MKINISTTTVAKFRVVTNSNKKEFNCNDINCDKYVECEECIFETCKHTLKELKNQNRIKIV